MPLGAGHVPPYRRLRGFSRPTNPTTGKVFDRVLAALQGVSDRVEVAELGTVYVALERTGGNLRRRSPSGPGPAERRVPGPWSHKVGLAHGKFPAYVAAKISGSSGSRPGSRPM